MKKLFPTILFFMFVNLLASGVFTQTQCFTKDETSRIIKSITTSKNAPRNERLLTEILRMEFDRKEIEYELVGKQKGKKELLEKRRKFNRESVLRLCEIYKKEGWLGENIIGNKGLGAVLYLIQNANDPKLQREWFPILVAASNQGQVKKFILANLIDSIRVRSGLPQIFGTYVVIRNEIGYLVPLVSVNKVDEWRKLYGLSTLNQALRNIERRYQTFVLKTKIKTPPKLKNTKNKQSETDILGLNDDEEILEIDSRIVNLNVRILNRNLQPINDLNLVKEDFEVFENNERQTVSFLSSKDTPFDLVLVLDLSGSTFGKRHIIWDAVKGFVNATRDSDRIAIVMGSYNEFKILANFDDKKKGLLKKAKKRGKYGASNIWDALNNTHEKVIKPFSKGRRTAIVFMTDGFEFGSNLAFGTLLENVRDRDSTIFSIHLDSGVYGGGSVSSQAYRTAGRTLKMLAEETGGNYHRVKKIKDLKGVYERIANELSLVYSLSYEPKHNKRDGSWQEIKIKIKNRPDLFIRTKTGYYAK